MNGISAAVIASILTAAPAVSEETEGGRRLPEIPFDKFKLSNGLDVILHEDHSTPIVCVDLWYHVGSKNERRGRTGFAHLFEHMMFQGSEHHDAEYFGPLQEAGGRLNGSTSMDRTNYWEVVPSNYLELALWLESDRMGFLLPAMSQRKLDNQRDVVKNERRQSYENRPYGLAAETIAAALYPPDHPYSWPTIGSMEDLSAASRDDIAAFFRRFYHPRNASLCIAGDIDPAETKRLVERYFGTLPAGQAVERMKPWVAELAAGKRIRMEDRVSLPRLYLSWPTVPLFAADDAELDLLASIFGSGKSSRLYRSLVHEKEIAQDVQVFQHSGEIAGAFHIQATARPGHELAELEAAIVAETARIQSEPPAAEELERAVNQYEARFVSALESVGGFGGRADRLNQYNVLAGDPGYIVKDFERYLQVDPAAVQRVAQKYLKDKRVVLEVVPGSRRSVRDIERQALNVERPSDSSTPEVSTLNASTRGAQRVSDVDRTVMPKPGPAPSFRLPPVHRAKLSSGLELLVVEHHELPTVSLNLVVRGGHAADPDERLGLSNLVAAVLDEGTEKRSATEIADQLAAVGAALSISAGWDITTARLFTLKRHLARALDIYGDVIVHPTFPVEELERQRGLATSRLVRLRDEPTVLASLAVDALLYGPSHPYGRPEFGSAASLSAIQRDDLTGFYRACFQPDRASLIVVGDVTTAEIVERLEGALADWHNAQTAPPPAMIPPVPETPPTSITLVDKPGAAQSVISVSQPGVLRSSPDYFPLVVVNAVFGGQFSSRLNLNLRENKGYTYGARSSFEWRQQPGPYVATASVQTAVTAPALSEFLKEFRGIAGERPVADRELEFAKAYLTRGFPASFETPRDIAGRLEDLVEFGLPDNYFDTVIPMISAVTADEVMRVAMNQIHPDHLAIIVVGDRAQIESSLLELPEGRNLRVAQFDDRFRLVPVEER